MALDAVSVRWWHGEILAAGFVVIVLLLTMMLNIIYALEAIERVADARSQRLEPVARGLLLIV